MLADIAKAEIERYVVNGTFTQAALYFKDGSHLQFEHSSRDNRWARASADNTIADIVCRSIRQFRLNAKHLQLFFEDGSEAELFALPDKPIEGLRIRLCYISLKDASAIAKIMTPDVSRWLASWPPDPTVEMVEGRITRAQHAMRLKHELHFRIEERDRNLTVGYVSVSQSETDRKVGHLSYWLGSAFHGKGYMTEAVQHAMAAAFRYLNLESIDAGAQPENLSSFAVMRRVGMTPIGERMEWAENRQRMELCLFFSIDRSVFKF